MSKKPTYWNSAIKYLSNKDKVMKKLINQYKDKTLTTRKDIFYSLCKSIIGQQISVAAANSVFKKFNKACKGKINSKVVKKLSFAKLKSCGLSRQKTKGIKELSIKFSNKSFDPKLLKNMDDEGVMFILEAIAYISASIAAFVYISIHGGSIASNVNTSAASVLPPGSHSKLLKSFVVHLPIRLRSALSCGSGP